MKRSCEELQQSFEAYQEKYRRVVRMVKDAEDACERAKKLQDDRKMDMTRAFVKVKRANLQAEWEEIQGNLTTVTIVNDISRLAQLIDEYFLTRGRATVTVTSLPFSLSVELRMSNRTEPIFTEFEVRDGFKLCVKLAHYHKECSLRDASLEDIVKTLNLTSEFDDDDVDAIADNYPSLYC